MSRRVLELNKANEVITADAARVNQEAIAVLTEYTRYDKSDIVAVKSAYNKLDRTSIMIGAKITELKINNQLLTELTHNKKKIDGKKSVANAIMVEESESNKKAVRNNMVTEHYLTYYNCLDASEDVKVRVVKLFSIPHNYEYSDHAHKLVNSYLENIKNRKAIEKAIEELPVDRALLGVGVSTLTAGSLTTLYYHIKRLIETLELNQTDNELSLKLKDELETVILLGTTNANLSSGDTNKCKDILKRVWLLQDDVIKAIQDVDLVNIDDLLKIGLRKNIYRR